MYTIFFTINNVEQLTFSTTFVEHLIFEQLIFFCLKVKLLEIHVRQMIFHDFWFSSNWQEKILLLELCRAIIKLCWADFSSNRILSRWSWPFCIIIRKYFAKTVLQLVYFLLFHFRSLRSPTKVVSAPSNRSIEAVQYLVLDRPIFGKTGSTSSLTDRVGSATKSGPGKHSLPSQTSKKNLAMKENLPSISEVPSQVFARSLLLLDEVM
jgi:hypothetical protein